MEKIDRLGWAAGVCFESYGVKIGVRVNKPEVPDPVPACLPPRWTPAKPPFVEHLFSLKIGDVSGVTADFRSAKGHSLTEQRATTGTQPRPRVRQFHLLYQGLGQIARTMDLDGVFEALENAVQLLVAEHARDRVFVHAGVVAWQGRALLLPGRSLAGKSSLTAALLRAGATYFSDEYAVLDRRGNVHPYPRRLSLRRPGAKLPDRRSAEELGGRTGSTPLPVALVAVTRYKPGSRWQPRPLTAGQAALELLNHAIPAQSRPDEVLSTLQRVAPHARNLKGVRGEADETAELLLRDVEHSDSDSVR